jgi:hypothetical protein
LFRSPKNRFFAAVGTLVVIVGSALVIGVGAINGFYENGVAYPFFSFFAKIHTESRFSVSICVFRLSLERLAGGNKRETGDLFGAGEFVFRRAGLLLLLYLDGGGRDFIRLDAFNFDFSFGSVAEGFCFFCR